MNFNLAPAFTRIPAALLSICVLGFASNAYSAVNITANSFAGGAKVTTSGGANLPVGSLVRIGFFTDPGANAAIISGSDASAIDGIFTELGDRNAAAGTGTGALSINGTGNFGGTITGVENGTVAIDTPIYMWILNVGTLGEVAGATEWGIFHDPLWTIPDGTVVLATLSMTTAQVDPADVLRGSDDGAMLRLAPIPEPSSLVFLLAGGLLFFRRKR